MQDIAEDVEFEDILDDQKVDVHEEIEKMD